MKLPNQWFVTVSIYKAFDMYLEHIVLEWVQFGRGASGTVAGQKGRVFG